ncbi:MULTISPECIES: FAD-binding protein [unclassified Paenibacillus]|uniref:FAD-binding protein n=1 Tax=unclassified Paenibacillus TaxID=185978 RepID=UPI0009544A75|nr:MULTISPECIES: FAD-binding protein [unclassified Paenibacillus]ASS67901.1 FAD-binding protein [Paenibacillus sp. RUD330]SIR44525.1 Succinate dehydrogenase/fumarate reductase, flavoprotein subunit [Paenibacillus sp. RU4X]SIR54250.1 Succinate dehydrogenase/fumarate reductase, flavoprotein subunit [Paenibacillus sp. RU4T]
MPAKKPAQWDHEVDVVVMGTGGAALTAALAAADQGAEVLILEKTHQIGGTTAFSGGIPWIPLNRYMMEAGAGDTREDALTYIRRLTGGKEPDADLLEVYVDNGCKMIDYMHENTPLRFAVPMSYPSYYGHLPGAKSGRSLDPLPFDLNEIGEWGALIRQNPIFPPLTLEEGGAIGGVDFGKIAERMENNIVTMGRSLIASMFKGVLDRGIETWLETPGKELVLDDAGEVIGIVAEREGKPCLIGTRKGVVIASGGFEWNKELVKTFLKGDITHPLSPAGNDGDGLVMAMEAGAALGNMSEAWWYPAMQDPTFEYEDRVMNQLGGGRFGPNSIIVNRRGKRFVHEGTAYNDMPKSFYEYDPVALEWPNEAPVWMIFDQQLKDSTMIITMMPGEDTPEWVNQAGSIRELAEQIGVDAEALEATVSRYNENAKQGVDPDFHRGTTFFENFGAGGGTPEANLGPIEKAPFYALPIYAGSLGTNGGPKINADGQVISLRGKPIPGLYAAGNAAMGVMGQAYLSAGGTIGPAMTFGYLAGIAVGNSQPRNI